MELYVRKNGTVIVTDNFGRKVNFGGKWFRNSQEIISLKKQITEIKFERGIQIIPARTFAFCENIKSIEIPDTVEIIETAAFMKCLSLKEITIPASVTVIEDYAFDRCHGLKEVKYLHDEAEFETLFVYEKAFNRTAI